MTATGEDLNWDALNPEHQATITRRLAKVLPDKSPAEFWREMGGQRQGEWLAYAEQLAGEAAGTYAADGSRIAAAADPETASTFGDLTDPSGDKVLNRVESYVSRFVAYPSEHARVAHVLWISHTHRMDSWESTPRIAFLSPEPGSGKSRALEVTEPLVPRPVHAVNTTPAYLFRKVSDPDGTPTILFDEIDTVFGPKAKENEEVRGLLNAGHRRGAVAGRCLVSGKVVMTEELPAYCAVALAGLDDLPDTLMSRCDMTPSVVIRTVGITALGGCSRQTSRRAQPHASPPHRRSSPYHGSSLLRWIVFAGP